MFEDYAHALVAKEDLEIVRKRLYSRMDEWHERMIKRVDDDFQTAQSIALGLKMAPDTISHRMAAAFLEDAKNEEKRKSEEDRWKERQRQEIEEAYYAAMGKEQEGKELNNDE